MVRLASGLRIAALFAAIAGIAISLSLGLFSAPDTATSVLKVSIDDANAADLPQWLRALVLLGPALAFAYAMWQLAKLLKLVAVGEVFSASASEHLRSFGVWLLITTLLQVLLGFAAKALYLWLSDAEHGRLDLTLDSSNLWNVFISALFMLVARVLADAYVIAEDNKQII